MVAGPGARTISFLSGVGGTGRTSAGIGLARYLAGMGKRTLLFDLCFGWGGLGLDNRNALTYEALLDKDDDIEDAIIFADEGYGLLTCLPPAVLDTPLDDLKRIVWLAHRLGDKCDFLILDPPSGGHPLALLAAGLSESIMLFSRPDAASVASSYCLLKSLCAEGIADRAGTVFSLVDSPEQAASLRTRFDILTGQFLGKKLNDFGFMPRLETNGDDGIEIGSGLSSALDAIAHLRLVEIAPFQNETWRQTAGAAFPGSSKVGR